MKRFVLFVLFILIALSFSPFAFSQSLTSKRLATVTAASSGVYDIGRGYITSVLITTDGSNDGSCTLYDSTGSVLSSEIILPTITVPGASMFGGGGWSIPLDYTSGLTAIVSGTGASCTIYVIR